MIKKLLIVLLALFSIHTVIAQNRMITGLVMSDSLPLPGVSINVKGTSITTSSKIDGSYSISVPANARTLSFSFVGYRTEDVTFGTTNRVDVILASESKQLDEVVVAFGTARKRTLTNSVAQISSKDLELRPITNLTNAIAGAAPGVQTNAGRGQPGEGPDIRIRGFSSINNGNGPLYVLDGAPYEGVLSNINVEDIESISMLKDASAAALYGARAGNGVILITTKRGNANRNQINVKVARGFTSRALPDYEKVDAYEYYPLMWETLRNSLISSTVTPEQAAITASATIADKLASNPFNVPNGEIVRPDGSMNPNARLLYPEDLSWNDALRQQGMRSDYSLSISGGAGKNDYYASVGYNNEKGFSLHSNFDRYTGRVRVNTQPKNWLKVGVNIGINSTKTDQAIESSGINENPFYIDLIQGPIYPVHQHDPITGEYILDANGNKKFNVSDTRPLFAGRNVVLETEYNVNEWKRNAITGNANIEAEILKGLRFTSNFGSNLNNYRAIVFDNRVAGDAIGVGRTSRTNTTSTYLNLNQLLNYEKSFGAHGVKALLGHESYSFNYDYFVGTRRGMIVDGTTVLDNFTTTTALGSYDRDYRTEGYLSRVEYNYSNKYVASASFRRDASSKFHPDKRWDNFYSLGG
ncbi:MAG TPA: SusC/RagA family TonB-linked outer membrane protein, partial [Segetibacter sp.]